MQNITYYKIWPRNQVKEENQTRRGHELRNLLIYKRSLYYKNISFRTKIFRISPKTDSIEANLPKRQLVLCTNLWCNSVSKPLLQKINTCFYIAAWLPPPTNSQMWFLWERQTQVSTETDKDGSEAVAELEFYTWSGMHKTMTENQCVTSTWHKKSINKSYNCWLLHIS